MTYLCVLIYFVFFAGVAMTVQEGLWTNTVNLIAVMLCGTLALVSGPPLGVVALEKFGKTPEFMWWFTFSGEWFVFFVSIMIFRLISERLSRVRVKFVPPVELAAGPVVGLLVAVMFTSFLIFTLYTAPVRAGEWDYDSSPSWQKTTMKTGSGPFYSLLKGLAGEEIADAHFAR